VRFMATRNHNEHAHEIENWLVGGADSNVASGTNATNRHERSNVRFWGQQRTRYARMRFASVASFR
jgi:hypothetical protein